MRPRQKIYPRFRVLTINWLGISCVVAVASLALAFGLAQAQGRDTSQPSAHKAPPQKPLDPMNRPMDELGVTGHDTTLCSDRWSTCSSYDRQQFDQKYPGQRLNELLLYGEPDWPDNPRDGREWQEKRDRGDSLDYQDRIDKD